MAIIIVKNNDCPCIIHNFCMPEGEKKNRNNFYWVILLVCISSIQFGSIATWSENYALGLGIFLIILTR